MKSPEGASRFRVHWYRVSCRRAADWRHSPTLTTTAALCDAVFPVMHLFCVLASVLNFAFRIILRLNFDAVWCLRLFNRQEGGRVRDMYTTENNYSHMIGFFVYVLAQPGSWRNPVVLWIIQIGQYGLCYGETFYRIPHFKNAYGLKFSQFRCNKLTGNSISKATVVQSINNDSYFIVSTRISIHLSARKKNAHTFWILPKNNWTCEKYNTMREWLSFHKQVIHLAARCHWWCTSACKGITYQHFRGHIQSCCISKYLGLQLGKQA